MLTSFEVFMIARERSAAWLLSYWNLADPGEGSAG